MNHHQRRVAELAAHCAKQLRDHGGRTDATCADWKLGPSAGQPEEGRTSQGTHSDPTLAAAMARPDQTTILARSWRVNLAHLIAEALMVDRALPSNVSPQAAQRAATALAAWFSDEGSRVDAQALRRAQVACEAICHVIRETTPLTIEQRRNLEDAKRALDEENGEAPKITGQPCEACTTPAEHCGKMRNGLCNACRTAETRRMQSGQYIDHQTFCASIANDVRLGLITRPHSPLFGTAAPSEGTAA